MPQGEATGLPSVPATDAMVHVATRFGAFSPQPMQYRLGPATQRACALTYDAARAAWIIRMTFDAARVERTIVITEPVVLQMLEHERFTDAGALEMDDLADVLLSNVEEVLWSTSAQEIEL